MATDTTQPTNPADDPKFLDWLLNHGGAMVSTVRGDNEWNRAVIRDAADTITDQKRAR